MAVRRSFSVAIDRGALLHVEDPAFRGLGPLARDGQVHEAEHRLARHAVALKEQVAEQRLAADTALVGRELGPARRLQRVALAALTLVVHPGEAHLGLGVAEVRGGIGIDLPGAGRILLHVRVGDAVAVVAAERHEGVGDESRIGLARAVLGVGVGHLAEQLERLVIVARDAVALGIHAAEFPLGDRVALVGGEAERLGRGFLVAALVRIEAVFQRVGRRRIRAQRIGIECSGPSCEAENRCGRQEPTEYVTYPHSLPLPLPRLDESRRHSALAPPPVRISRLRRFCSRSRAATIFPAAPPARRRRGGPTGCRRRHRCRMASPSSNQRDRSALAASGPTWPMQKPRVPPGEAPVGDQRDLLAQPLPIERRRGRQHLAHAGAAASAPRSG
jgi:hypothetical protein